MLKNTSGQSVGAQMVSASDGSAFTGSVTVYVTVDRGTQAVGSVGSGACAHEGNGCHTYGPDQAETNGDHIAFTFVGTGAVPQTVQVYTRAGDAFTRLGAPAGASVSADIAAAKSDTAAIKTKTDNLPSDPADASDVAAAIGGLNDLSAGDVRDAVGLAAPDLDEQLSAIGADAEDAANDAGLLAGMTEDVSGRRWTEKALEQAPSGGGGGGGDWTADEKTVIRAVLGIPSSGTTPDDPSTGILDTIRDAVGTRASQTSVDDLPTNSELATALAAADDAVLAQVALIKAKTDGLPSDPADASDVAAALASLNDLSAAEVNAEVVDALATDTYAEITGVPGFPASFATMLRRVYAALINPVEVTASKKQFKNAAGTAQWEKDLADSGSAYTESAGNAP